MIPDEPKKPAKQALGKGKQSVKARANEREKRNAKLLGGVVTPASGATPAKKGDIDLEEWLIDLKSTEANQVTITRTMLTKLKREAREAAKYPLLLVEIGEEEAWAMMPAKLFTNKVKETLEHGD